MKTSLVLAALSLLSFSAVACADGTDGDVGGGEDELRTRGITEVRIGRSSGFTPPPPPGSCRPAGRYTVSFTAKKITGQGCAAGRQISVDRTLSDEELTTVKRAVSGVREVELPPACPTDMPVTSLLVKKAQSETFYVDQRAACGGGKAATEATLFKLYKTAEDLAVKGQVQRLEGDLLSMMAIGGESTGTILASESGHLELDFGGNEELAREFVAGQKALVTGKRVDRPGVEIPMRHFLEVEDIVVCPNKGATVNCMPITTAKACVPANRDWIERACDDVGFVD